MVPTVLVRDGTGAAIDSARALRIGWLPMANAIVHFTAPTSGSYSAEIGASAGSGAFQATLTGNVPNNVQVQTLHGVVSNDFNGEPLADVLVTVGAFHTLTSPFGEYDLRLNIGDYTATFELDGYETSTEQVSLRSGDADQLDVELVPTTRVVIETAVSGSAVPGGTVTVAATIEILDGSALQSVQWTQTGGATRS